MPSYKSPSPSPITAMFIRVKRKKTTYFLHCDPSETVLEIKQKLQALSDNPVDCQRLILLSSQLVLEDSKSLADQKVENDAIVALCLRTSDPRVHRIATGLRTPTDPKLLLELSKSLAALKPATPKKASAEAGEQVAEDGESPPPPPPPATVLLDRAMSTLLRVPFQPPPPTPEEVAKKEAAEKEAARLETLKKLQKDDLKVQAKKESKLGGKKEEKNEVGKKSDKKGSGKKGPDKKKGKKGKKGEKDEIEDKPQVEEILPPPDSGVWEDICIDRLSDYATLIDSD